MFRYSPAFAPILSRWARRWSNTGPSPGMTTRSPDAEGFAGAPDFAALLAAPPGTPLPREAVSLPFLGLVPTTSFLLDSFLDFFGVSDAGSRGLATSRSRNAFGARMLKSGRVGEMLGAMLGILGIFGPAPAGVRMEKPNPATIVVAKRSECTLAMTVLHRGIAAKGTVSPIGRRAGAKSSLASSMAVLRANAATSEVPRQAGPRANRSHCGSARCSSRTTARPSSA
jgi:hypothetical protein